MRGVLKRVALGLAMVAPFVTTVGCADSTCVYGYYGGYCYTYGYYYDSLVSGVSYESSGQAGDPWTGVTGEETGEETEPGPGSFRYVEGDMVSFSLGDTLLGETRAKERITPFDLAGLEEPQAFGGCDASGTLPEGDNAFRVVTNLAVLLQSLDTDGDATNGIDISPDVAALFNGVDIDLSQAWEAFQADTDLQAVLGTRVLRGRVDALRALYQGIGLCP
jgi:hypothetical protein